MPSRRRFPIDPEAYFPAIVAAIGLVIGYAFGWWILWVPCLIALVLLLGFFRDPPRRVPQIPGAVVSPADGKVTAITVNQDPEAGPVGGPVISIFLSVLDVHINRAPYAGRITDLRYRPGDFLNALNVDSGKRNEANWIFMECGRHHLTVRQIAGLIARRIVCRVRKGDRVRRGQRIGLIRFGSRTELYLPPEARVQVEVGQRVSGGRTVVAYLPE